MLPPFAQPLTDDGQLEHLLASCSAEGHYEAKIAAFRRLRSLFAAESQQLSCFFSYSGLTETQASTRAPTQAPAQLVVLGYRTKIAAYRRIQAEAETQPAHAQLVTATQVDDNQTNSVTEPIAAGTDIHQQVLSSMPQHMAAAEAKDPQTLGWFGGWCCFNRPPLHGEPPNSGEAIDQGRDELLACFYAPKIVVDFTANTISFTSHEQAESWQPLFGGDLDTTSQPLPPVHRLSHTPSCAEYVRLTTPLITALEQHELDKIVVGRTTCVECSAAMDPLDVLAHVRGDRHMGFTIMVQDGATDEAWLSISPELLASVVGRTLTTQPLAGTRKGSADPAMQRRTQWELLHDDKEQREHAFAADVMEARLLPLMAEGSLQLAESPSVLDLGYVKHLASTLKGELKPGKSVYDVLKAIYPPATIWGLPHDGIAGLLQKVEPFARQLFTGGFGFVDRKVDGAPATSLFALVIRCATLSHAGQRLTAYAGSGLVAGSDPAKEWYETADKMQPFIGLFAPQPAPGLSRFRQRLAERNRTSAPTEPDASAS